MQPYNECENRWLSKIKKVKDHYDRNEPFYSALALLMLVALLMLACITSIGSFFEIVS